MHEAHAKATIDEKIIADTDSFLLLIRDILI